MDELTNIIEEEIIAEQHSMLTTSNAEGALFNNSLANMKKENIAPEVYEPNQSIIEEKKFEADTNDLEKVQKYISSFS